MRRSFGYQNYNAYRPGGGYFICDRCSQRWRRTFMLTEWTGLKVDAKCLDPRPPQMMPPDVFPEGMPFLDARVPQDNPDRLEDDTALQSVPGGFVVQVGQTYPNGQNQQPGALSPLPVTESVTADPYDPEPGNPSVGTPIGPDVLADDVTFITGPVTAPTNTFDTITPQIPAPNPAPVVHP